MCVSLDILPSVSSMSGCNLPAEYREKEGEDFQHHKTTQNFIFLRNFVCHAKPHPPFIRAQTKSSSTQRQTTHHPTHHLSLSLTLCSLISHSLSHQFAFGIRAYYFLINKFLSVRFLIFLSKFLEPSTLPKVYQHNHKHSQTQCVLLLFHCKFL